MKNLTHWILALVALVTVASFSGALTSQQERGKVTKIDKGPAQRGRGEKQALLKKFVPTSKTSLAEGIALAEKETAGKAFSAGFELQQSKPQIRINLFAGEKTVIATVDPETKKVTVLPQKEKPDGGAGDDVGDDVGGDVGEDEEDG
jgi:hypothetical protein